MKIERRVFMIPSSSHTEKRVGARDRILQLLLVGQKTVEQMAEILGVTKNAIRAQIALLFREGLVEVKGEVKGSRRPAGVYGIRTGADVGSSKAYPVVLSQLVRVLGDRMPSKQFESIMKDVGRGMAAAVARPEGSARERVAGAVKVLQSLGSIATVSDEGGKIVIKGNGCPISRAVEADERSCAVMESFLAGFTGLPVTERCDHGERPNCRFEITVPPRK
jgi:predicted ArsR family transcriptional regulator